MVHVLSPTNYTCVPTNHAGLFWMENVDHSFLAFSAAMVQNKLHDFYFSVARFKNEKKQMHFSTQTLETFTKFLDLYIYIYIYIYNQ